MAIAQDDLAAWDSYVGQLITAHFDTDRPEAAASLWAGVADTMLVERRKRARLPDELPAWDGYFGNLIAGFRGVQSGDPHLVALACASAANAADAVLAQRRIRTAA
jgi:hypothetical protein